MGVNFRRKTRIACRLKILSMFHPVRFDPECNDNVIIQVVKCSLPESHQVHESFGGLQVKSAGFDLAVDRFIELGLIGPKGLAKQLINARPSGGIRIDFGEFLIGLNGEAAPGLRRKLRYQR